MLLRVSLVLTLVAVVALATIAYRRRRSIAAAESPFVSEGGLPAVPAGFLGGAERTWLLFTTPYCATCGSVETQLRAADPAARVVRVDAAQETRLAGDLGIRSAPTAVLAAADGNVEVRLRGSAAVARYLAGNLKSATRRGLS